MGVAVIVTLAGLGMSELDLRSVLVFKTVFSVVLGLIVTPTIGLLALSDSPTVRGSGVSGRVSAVFDAESRILRFRLRA